MGVADIKQRWLAIKNRVGGTLGPDAKPLEIRAAIVDAIEDRVEPIGRGRRRCPFNRVVIRVVTRTADDKAAFKTVFADLDAKVRERLQEIRCDPIEIEYVTSFVTKAPAGWSEGQLFAIECQQREREAAPTIAPSGPAIRIQVLSGTAARKSYVFGDSTILVGRTMEARDPSGRRRRNHVAFDDGNTTVSRAHARFKLDPAARRYHVLDDGSLHGTTVVRGGETIHVPQRDPRGVLIQSGDEIQFGDAAVRVIIE
jgi:FHA domain